jgi:hypothetical protein
MKNKNLFLLSLFSLLPAATQCMEPIKQITVAEPKTMQEILNARNKIYQKILIKERSCQLNSQHYRTGYNGTILDTIIFRDKNALTIHSFHLKNFRFKECSCLGLTTIRIERPEFTYEDRYGAYHNDCLIQNPKHVPFKEKKEYIQQLRTFDFESTDADKELDKLGAYEQAALSKLLLQHSPFLSEIELPQDIVNYIAIIMSEIRLLS